MPISQSYVSIQAAAQHLGTTPHEILMLGLSGGIPLYRAIPCPGGVVTVYVLQPNRPEEKAETKKSGVCLKPLIDLEILELIESGQVPPILYVEKDDLRELTSRQTRPNLQASDRWDGMTLEEKKAAWNAMTPKQRRAKARELVERHGGNRTAAGAEVGITGNRIGQLLKETEPEGEPEAPLPINKYTAALGLSKPAPHKPSR